jgi:hypothetical protein
LNVEPGGWGCRVGDAGQRQDLAAARAQDGDPAEAPGQRLDRRLLDLGVDRRVRGAAALREARGDHAPARVERAPGRPAQLVVELALEPGQPDGRAARDALGLESGRALSGRRADRADHLRDRGVGLAQAGVALREHGAVTRLDRRAARHPGLAREALAGPQPGHDVVGAPVHAGLAVGGLLDRQAQRPVHGPEDPRAHRHRDVDVAVGDLAGATRRDRRQRHRLGRFPVGAHEPLGRGAPARGRTELRVHRAVVALLPRGQEALDRARRGVLVAGAHDEPGDQRRERGDQPQRDQPPASLGPTRSHRFGRRQRRRLGGGHRRQTH